MQICINIRWYIYQSIQFIYKYLSIKVSCFDKYLKGNTISKNRNNYYFLFITLSGYTVEASRGIWMFMGAELILQKMIFKYVFFWGGWGPLIKNYYKFFIVNYGLIRCLSMRSNIPQKTSFLNARPFSVITFNGNGLILCLGQLYRASDIVSVSRKQF